MKYIHNSIFIFIILLTTAVSHAGIVYDESVDGDLNGQTIALQSGANDIFGTFSFFIDEPNGVNATYESDSWRYSLASGLTLEDYSITILAKRVIESGNITVLTGRFRVDSDFPSSPAIYSSSSSLVVPDTVRTTGNLGLNDFTGFFTAGFRGFGNISSASGSVLGNIEYDYIATANVSGNTAVPIPAGAWLFLSAIGGLAGMRLKR